LIQITEVTTDLLPVKRGDPGRPVITISIGMVDFPEALYDFGSSVNIMPRVLYEKFFTYPLLETTMCLKFADWTLSFLKGILKNLCVRVGTLYAPANFVVIETGNDERAILKHLGSCHVRECYQDQFLHQREEGDVFLQEQDYTIPRAIST